MCPGVETRWEADRPHSERLFVFRSPFTTGPERSQAQIREYIGRRDCDIFPTRYRANTPRRLRALMAECGLEQERFSLLASDAVLASAHPLLTALELLYLKMTMAPTFRFLRVTMLSNFVKFSRTGPGA